MRTSNRGNWVCAGGRLATYQLNLKARTYHGNMSAHDSDLVRHRVQEFHCFGMPLQAPPDAVLVVKDSG